MTDRYTKRLENDLDRWIADGLVPATHRAAILGAIAPLPSRWSAQGAAAILGAILLALAALTFVAANWSDLPRVLRFLVIGGALSAAYGGAAFALVRKATAIGHALALLGAVLFGAGIALTAQTFNISSFYQTGLWIWAFGALATAVAIPSRPVLILASVLAGSYALVEAGNSASSGPVLLYLPLIGAIAVAAWRMKSTVTMNLVGLSFVIWLLNAVYELQPHPPSDVALIASYTLCAGAMALATAWLSGRGLAGSRTLSAWTLAAAAASLIAVQGAIGAADAATPALSITLLMVAALGVCVTVLVIQSLSRALDRSVGVALIVAALLVCALPWIDVAVSEGATLALELILGGLVFMAAVALILIGTRPGATLTGAIGIALFIGQSIYVYAELFGDLLNTATFFLVGGVLLIALSFALTRWRKGIATPGKEATS